MPDPRSPRERTEELERASLSGWATLSAESKGREHLEDADPMRTAFQADVDRIVASDAFTRLRGKSARLLPLTDGGYRRRLDHSLAVSRIGRTIARALRLNEDLTEAIALGCDLGAPAFARAGEEALSLFTDEPFRHNHQSLRVVEAVEQGPAPQGGSGLNLSWEVRDGIACHTLDAQTPATREGEVVRLADRIAALVGEVADALRAGVVVAEDLPATPASLLGPEPHTWAGTLVADAVGASAEVPEIRLGEELWDALDELGTFVDDRIAGRHGVLAERARGSHCLSSLVVFHMDNPRRLPSPFRVGEDPLRVRVIDFVTSLTDAQAVQLFARLFVPDNPAEVGRGL